jgi:glycosyltransferase involved in cell wall biosynthesis
MFMTAILMFWVAITAGFDTVQATSPPDLLWIVAAPYRLFGKKYVFDHHDLSPELYRARFGGTGFTHRMLLMAEEYAVALADAVISTNAVVRDRVAARTGVPLERFTVVRNGPLLAEVPQKHPARDDLKKGRRWLCCWHGVMGREDGVDLAVRAAASLVHEFGRRDCGFALIGDGEARDELEALAIELDVTAWIEFPGWLGPTELSGYLATADIGLSPDPPDEHLDWMTPIKVIEYMAYGVPVVGFRRSEQTASAGRGGVFIPGDSPSGLAAAIDDLLDHPERRRDIGNHGRKRLEDGLAWDHQEKHYLALHRRFVAGGGDR